MSTWRMTREPGAGKAIRLLMVRGGDKSLRRGRARTGLPGRSESEERPSRVREVSEEEHGEDGGQHDNRQGDEDGGVDGPGDRLFRGTGLRLEDVHIPDHARVIVQGQGAIQDAEIGRANV